jgi:hypothetical protein
MAELVDALDSKSSIGNDVGVRVPLEVLKISSFLGEIFLLKKIFLSIPKCRFYPNPVSEIVNFDIDKREVSEIMLTNLCIGESDVFKVSDMQSFNLSFLPKGVYQLSLRDEHHALICADKIIKK